MNFDWKTSPYSSVYYPVVGSIVYILVIFCLKTTYNSNSRFERVIRILQLLHNAILSIGSFALMSVSIFFIYQRYTEEGALFLLCEQVENSRGVLYYCSYIYYLSKYYELLDTVLQLIKGRDPPNFFFGVYHHSVVLYMAWLWLEHQQSTQFIGLIANCFVHTVMYYYYFLVVWGVKPHWKRMVTKIQIIQFIISLAVLIGHIIVVLRGNVCRGEAALVFNALFNISLLYLFIGIQKKSTLGSKSEKKE